MKYLIRKRAAKIFMALLLAWVIFAQSCATFRTSDAKAKADFQKAGVNLNVQTLAVDGYQMHYAQTGADTLPTLFFVHGSPGSWDAFAEYMQDPDLLAKYRMVSIDRPGFGYSNYGDAKNLAEQSRLIGPILKNIQNGRDIYVVGHSLGGPLAVKLAADYPGTFAGIVLLAASVDPAEEAPERWRYILKTIPLRYLLPGAFRPSNDEIVYFKKDIIPLAEQFADIRCDVWIVHGDKDSFVPVGNAYFAQKMLVNATSVHTTILKGAPHFIPWKPWYIDVKEILINLK